MSRPVPAWELAARPTWATSIPATTYAYRAPVRPWWRRPAVLVPLVLAFGWLAVCLLIAAGPLIVGVLVAWMVIRPRRMGQPRTLRRGAPGSLGL